jgi:C4-dicarboxylate transporter DctQ subunit
MLSRIIESVSTVSGWLSGIGIYAMVGIVFLDVILRYFWGNPTDVADIISVYSMLFITFVGAALTTKLGKHVSVDLLFERLSPTAKMWVHAVTTCLATVVLAVISWKVIDWIIYTFNTGYVSAGTMEEPMWIPLSAIPIGFILWTLQYIVESLKAISVLQNHYAGVRPKASQPVQKAQRSVQND